MASADPDLALRLAKATADLYSDAVARLLSIVAGRLARGIEAEGWAERKLIETAALRDQVQAEVRRLEASTAVADAISAGWDAGAEAGARELVEAGLRPMASSLAVDALVRETVTAVHSTHLRILRTTVDEYRNVIAEASGGVVSGVDTRRQAAQRALDRFADRGVTGFVDNAGRSWDLSSYAEMATRTGAGRAQVAGALDRFTGAGRDLVIVSDSPRECSRCRPWEGRILSVRGGDQQYPSVAEATAAGLLHANCTHALNLYVPGLTRAPGRTADPQGDAAKQEQRRLERGVRQWRRRQAVAITPEAEALAKRKASEWSTRLGEHVKANDLKRQRYRETVGAR